MSIHLKSFRKFQPIRDDLLRMIPGHLLRIGNQGDYDVMWGEFPGSMDVPRCMNHVKILYRFTYASAVGGDVLGRYKFGT